MTEYIKTVAVIAKIMDQYTTVNWFYNIKKIKGSDDGTVLKENTIIVYKRVPHRIKIRSIFFDNPKYGDIPALLVLKNTNSDIVVNPQLSKQQGEDLLVLLKKYEVETAPAIRQKDEYEIFFVVN